MALAAYLGLRLLGEKRRAIAELGELMAVGGFLHQRMAIDACNPPARMGARLPIGLTAALVAA